MEARISKDRTFRAEYSSDRRIDIRMSIGILNAEVIHKKTNPSTPQTHSSLTFRRQVALEMIGRYTSRKKSSECKGSRKTSGEGHLPSKSEKRRNCVLCYSRTRKEVKSGTECGLCKVSLCFTKARNCFEEYHTT